MSVLLCISRQVRASGSFLAVLLGISTSGRADDDDRRLPSGIKLTMKNIFLTLLAAIVVGLIITGCDAQSDHSGHQNQQQHHH